MPDKCDLGAERTQQMLDDALDHRRYQASRLAISNLYCDDCGCAIPLKRREALIGVECCVDCQAIREHKGVCRG